MRNKVIYSGVLGAVCLTAVSVSNTFAQITPQQIATVKSVSGAKISADGQYIAYTLSTPVDPKKDNLGNSSHLYVVKMSTGQASALYTANNVAQVEFKPNSSIITFVTKEKDEKTNAIYQVNAQGGDVKKVYQYSSNIAGYNWHHDGAQLAFISAERTNKPKTSLTYSPSFFEEEYPDRNAYIVNTTQSADPQKINVTGSAYMIKWSPNGQKIALSVAPTSSVDDSYMAQSIKIVDAKSRNIVAHIDNKGKLGQFVWSPDGNTIAIVGAYDLNDPTDGTLLTVSAQGGTPKVIDGDFQGKYESIIWTEDKDIYFLASEGVSSGIGRISVDGKNKMYHRKSDNQHFTSFSIAKTGQIAYTANSSTHPNELFTVHNRNRKAPMQLTSSNPWMKDLKFGRQEVVTYKARDGKYDIQGLLIYPLDYKEGTQYPLITVVHGGPESHYSNGWLTGYSMPGQMGATEGYAVFYPNYRGSTGRGVDFTYSSQSDLAGKEFDDIVDGVDYLINMGLVDPKRVGVTGGSYGGYASAWMSTYYSDRFAAAVMFVGISNNISKFGTSDIPTEMRLVHERGNIWDDWQKQLEISPIYHVDKANTPILIMHGAEDPRVHPAQSMELYRHIKVRKPEVPVRLIYYPGEGHGNARSGSKYDYNLRMMQWFDVYLKSGNRKASMPSLDLPE